MFTIDIVQLPHSTIRFIYLKRTQIHLSTFVIEPKTTGLPIQIRRAQLCMNYAAVLFQVQWAFSKSKLMGMNLNLTVLHIFQTYLIPSKTRFFEIFNQNECKFSKHILNILPKISSTLLQAIILAAMTFWYLFMLLLWHCVIDLKMLNDLCLLRFAIYTLLL